MTLADQTDDIRPPCHVAIIMDGNGRWAQKKRLPRVAGHKKGADAVRKTVKACAELGVSYLTLYAFSSENWKRPADEVDDLMGLLRIYLRKELKELNQQNVRVRFIGERGALAKDITGLISNAESTTAKNTGLTLVLAINYGSRAEVLNAAKRLAQAAIEDRLQIENIDEKVFESLLETADIPDPDLIIRTSGEQRLSNFLLWQAAYAELVFLEILWPDFDKSALQTALSEYQMRERRYGARL